MPSDIEIVRRAGRAVGRVQGVGFRMFVRREATLRGVTGWVKNISDGSVAMELQGESSIVDELIARIKRGRGRINVTSLDVAELPVAEGEIKFVIRK